LQQRDGKVNDIFGCGEPHDSRNQVSFAQAANNNGMLVCMGSFMGTLQYKSRFLGSIERQITRRRVSLQYCSSESPVVLENSNK
jgi:hypothetical protein